MFIPATKEEVKDRGWDNLDIILVSGDTYIDSSYIGVSVIGHVLIDQGYRVGIIAQPDINSDKDINRLGEPMLFWGITSGSVDSMVSNYTSSGKKRRKDDLTPGGKNDRRPDRALIAYSNLIRRFFKNTVPIVLGGIEASLRRVAHYDLWSNNIRRSVLFDAKADILVYGMGEKSIIELADSLQDTKDISNIRGICYINNNLKNDFIALPDYEECAKSSESFEEMFHAFYGNNDPYLSKGLYQRHGDRYLIQNPPSFPLTSKELDRIYDLTYERDTHPFYKKDGEVRALNTIRFSITTHRGCAGECNFCSINLHQGKRIVSRTVNSIVNEAKKISGHKKFKGIINDVGGPTANMYKSGCKKDNEKGVCKNKRCISYEACDYFMTDHESQIEMLIKLSKVPGIKKIFIASGIRHDLILHDSKFGIKYLDLIVKNHISGQMKVAPEHSDSRVLKLMGKPAVSDLLDFKKLFEKLNKKYNKKQYLTYYLIAAHPGCSMREMESMKYFVKKNFHIKPEQIQIFTPTPSTYSTLMYYTGRDPFSGEEIYVERDPGKKIKQKKIVT